MSEKRCALCGRLGATSLTLKANAAVRLTSDSRSPAGSVKAASVTVGRLALCDLCFEGRVEEQLRP